MKQITDIDLIDLILGFSIMIIPVLLLLYYKIKLVKSILLAIVRMSLQLSLVAVYLEWIFEQNNAWINSLWVFVMIVVGASASIKRIGLNWRFFILPMFLSSFISVLIIDTFFLGFVIRLDYVFDARYFIPITGMIIGNSLNHNIVGLTAYFKGLSEKSDLYFFLLTNASDSKMALRPYISESVKRGLNPMIAMMTVMGLISLPGMMTGQILGGSSPTVAIKYQIMIMLAIFTGCTINLFLGILLSNRFVFDGYGRLKEGIFKGGNSQ
ncbi:ABC transporter permease [Plebeiibacterium marinum]|uniref:ABC transporter permease n=1 Tax=Plebeiibacterium marinum TaxID=2992111 RepID=A0AAE3ME44_9BACT|nr:ABC transporter permease [Plebeiobacterium marinum]MCW3805917.1 ABC transporter permease [Plebeiobacterium marinum]